MRIFLWLLTLFAAAIGFAVAARFNPGNVVLFYPPYRIDLSLNLFLLLALALFLVLHVILRTIDITREMPAKVAAYRNDKREREGNRALRDALKSLFEGRYGQAEKAARRAAEWPDNAGLAALIGARAAHRMRQTERRDAWLSQVQSDSSLKIARLMTTIELQVDEHQPEQALEAVKELNATGARHIHALRLALKANQRAGNWPEVLRLVRLLDKHNALHPALSRRLRELAYEDMLAARSHDAESIRRVWSTIPSSDRIQPFVAARAARVFNARGLHEEAREVVEKALAAEWDDRLVRAYRESAAPEGSPELLAQIERCEEWLNRQPTDPELALTLGALCLRQKLWGKAQRHLEQALSDASASSMAREAHLKLAQLHEALGQDGEAATHYRQCALTTML
ncbi:MAG TPA: heme biosynthesis protein HemY [Paucimonas sp.]|nr:heme biosynthesis protein HemY [Paucimonas sp.]